jgi:PleD family two-component response regulator
MFGVFRSSPILRDARNQFTKNANKRMSQTQKRNARRAMKVVMENADILREGRAALAAANARIMAAAHGQSVGPPPQAELAAEGPDGSTAAVGASGL